MQSCAPSSCADLRILIVDDEYLVAVYLEALLEDLGCEVVGPVATIEEALAIVRSERVDGVLLDANLNGISSTPIAEELLASSIPFIVVTGYGQLKLGSDLLDGAPRLTKPLITSDFERVVAAIFLA